MPKVLTSNKGNKIFNFWKNYLNGGLVNAEFAALLLGMIYLVGIGGLLSPSWRPLFEKLTPFILIISGILLLIFHKDWNKYFLLALLVIPAWGYAVEVFGVKTGLLFGNYTYGPTLGFALWDVPLLIGLNWFLLVYLFGNLVDILPGRKWLKTILGAFLMVAIDYIMEPVAIFHDFWKWENGIIPFKNYLGWFLNSLFLMMIFLYLPFDKTNKFSGFLLVIHIGFFLILRIIY